MFCHHVFWHFQDDVLHDIDCKRVCNATSILLIDLYGVPGAGMASECTIVWQTDNNQTKDNAGLMLFHQATDPPWIVEVLGPVPYPETYAVGLKQDIV